MDEIQWKLYPLVAASEHSRVWLLLQSHLQLAPKTIDAYGRSLNDFLAFCQRCGIVPETITREQVVVVALSAGAAQAVSASFLLPDVSWSHCCIGQPSAETPATQAAARKLRCLASETNELASRITARWSFGHR